MAHVDPDMYYTEHSELTLNLGDIEHSLEPYLGHEVSLYDRTRDWPCFVAAVVAVACIYFTQYSYGADKI